MKQLIDKSALIAEIKRKIKNINLNYVNAGSHPSDFEVNKKLQDGISKNLQSLLSFIDTLEVKEVDLEDSVKETLRQKYIDYTFKRHNIDPESREGLLIYYAYMHGMNQCLDKLNAQKGE